MISSQPRSCSAAGERASWRSASSTGSRSVEGARSEPVIIALGEKVFGALLVITGAAIILTGHWTTTDDMIADLIAGGLMLAFGVIDVELSALNAAPVRRGDGRLLHRPRRQ